jgi:predicted negative regulator of RcsB-dependent stress response
VENPVKNANERWIDIGIWVAGAAVVGLIAFIGWSYWSHYQSERAASPAARAVESLIAIVKAKPQDVTLRLQLAEALVADNRSDEAVQQVKAALTIKKDFAPALIAMGKLARIRKEYQTAEGYFLKVLDQSTTNQALDSANIDEAYYNLGIIYLEQKRNEEAVEAFKGALGVRKDASDSHYLLSVAYGRLGFIDKQKQELDITLAFDPKNAQANYDRGLMALKEGDRAEAAELFRIAADNVTTIDLPQKQLQLLASEASAEDRMQRAQELSATNLDKALSEARIAAALEPTNVDAARLVARLADRKKDTAGARSAWQQVLHLSANDTEALAALKRLGE